ncbi:protein PHOTOSYSTEM I ASSEMBLY 2, chloroplastic isoform X2 [Cryptomeria japonica]|uniref:protein PHOTOSYSTEM I ASSEMBLY 2, chloroplastic isoform X2 n=1 Tax=Cryptomeria japonica TaxID=3369 RepID=UPI0027DA535E|nr:protein PHOTOSYSTEM I ASSEMBLY 2, chloroplastic isoform X2 [Cryptomeria japonica]
MEVATSQIQVANINATVPPWAGAVITVTLLSLSSPLLLQLARPKKRLRKCSQCLGVGNNLCLMCKGRGKQGGLFTGEPLEKCSTCAGRGRQLCTQCAGKGIINR